VKGLRQCLGKQRFKDIKSISEEAGSWSTACNKKQRGVDWQFKINDARIKLKSLYPRIKC